MADNKAKTGATLFLDTTSAQAALTKLNASIDKYDASLKNTKLSGQEAMALEAKRNSAATQAAEIRTRIEQGLGATYKEQAKYVADLTKEIKNLATGTQAYNQKVQDLRKATGVFDEMKAKIKGVDEAQAKATTGITKMGVAAAAFAANFAANIANKVGSYISDKTKMLADFEQSVANLSAITGATGKDLDFFKNAAVELSATTTRSAVDYVEAMKLIGSAKPELLANKEALLEVTKAASLLADASGLALPDASKRLTDALNQFGAPAKDAAKYVDALAAASKFGAAEVPDITDALLQFGSQAKSANINIYESSAAIELLAEKGIKGAEAGTKLRNIFLALNAVKSLDRKALDSLAEAGVNTDRLSDKTLTLEQRLKELSKVSGDASALVNIFGKENFNAAQIVLQNIPRYAELAGQVKEIGVANQQAVVNTDTLTAAWAKLGNVADSQFLKEGGSFTSFLKNIVNGLAAGIAGLGGFLKGVAAIVTYDFSYFSKNKAEQKAIGEAQANAIAVKGIIEAYSKDRLGKERKQTDIIKSIRADEAFAYEQLQDAKAKGDKKRFAQYLQEFKNTSAAFNQVVKDGKTVAATVPTSPTSTTKGSASTSTSTKPTNTFDAIMGDLGLQNTKATGDKLDIAFAEIDKKIGDFRKRITDDFANGKLTEAQKDQALAALIGLSVNDIEKATKTFKEEVTKKRGDTSIVSIPLAVQLDEKLMQANLDKAIKMLEENAKKAKEMADRDSLAGAQVNVLKNPASLQAKIALLDEEMRLALEKENLTENEKEKIRLEFANKRKETEMASFQEAVNNIAKYASQALDILSKFNSIRNSAENAALAKDAKANDAKKNNLKKQLDAKLITQQNYDRQVAALDKAQEEKKKAIELQQFERNKKIQIAQSVINGALAITNILATVPKYDFGIISAIQIGLAIATTAASIATIASSKPQFAKGALLDGPSHASGGMPIINPNTGKKVAEIEGGEAILSKATVRNNWPLVSSLLQASINNNGATVTPFWQNRTYQGFNYQAVTSAQRKFATGGVFTDANGNNAQVSQQNSELTMQLFQAIQRLNQNVEAGIPAYINYDKLTKAITTVSDIQATAALK